MRRNKLFELTQHQQQKLREWFDVCDKLILEKQKNEMSKEDFVLKTGNGMYPYFGAIGGNYKYSFTPNSIGMCVEVTNIYLNETLDLTDYEAW